MLCIHDNKQDGWVDASHQSEEGTEAVTMDTGAVEQVPWATFSTCRQVTHQLTHTCTHTSTDTFRHKYTNSAIVATLQTAQFPWLYWMHYQGKYLIGSVCPQPYHLFVYIRPFQQTDLWSCVYVYAWDTSLACLKVKVDVIMDKVTQGLRSLDE